MSNAVSGPVQTEHSPAHQLPCSPSAPLQTPAFNSWRREAFVRALARTATVLAMVPALVALGIGLYAIGLCLPGPPSDSWNLQPIILAFGIASSGLSAGALILMTKLLVHLRLSVPVALASLVPFCAFAFSTLWLVVRIAR